MVARDFSPWTLDPGRVRPSLVLPPGGRTECHACTSSALRAEEEYRRGGWEGAYQGLEAPGNERTPYGRRMDCGSSSRKRKMTLIRGGYGDAKHVPRTRGRAGRQV